ncbi:U3 small nucleolar RNA-associated protein 14 homolog C [Drosophila grimshawi]|uniref:GH14745 n=1 Tax=Drosophila grimshawi TaxID=7222 RepID=B4IWU5_DROGR|nr:U3 small nucleolar RNA-associated protein 14 homolog C [Drosophila grimshawi]EDV97346.1 GH14745 [Drosophila grimshawi]
MSDDEEQYNAVSHKKLLQTISNLGNVQHIRKSTRDERQQKQDEFQLVKSVNTAEHAAKAVGLNDLVQILRTSKHIETGKKLKNVHSTKKVLQKPLEKPAADRIKRTIGYESVSKKLGRWDAVVAKQRSAETQIFPIPTETIYVNTAAHSNAIKTSIKSELAKELQASNEKLRQLRKAQIGDNTDEKTLAQQEQELLQKKMNRQELYARRRELAYLKMRESQKSAKARMQNKIKSKKYHKLQKRQKILEQMKEFELLQKTNPEAALEKLNALEKSRVMERASLRHKNTGTWAKNLQVRAKYDKDVRKDLAEQLAVSRQLTEKKVDTDSEDEPAAVKMEANEQVDNDPFNPWTKVKTAEKPDTQTEENEPNWRTYWTERNKNEKLLAKHRAEIEDAKLEKVEKLKVEQSKKQPKTKSMKKKKKSVSAVENGWVVEEVKEPPVKTQTIEDIFDKHEENIRQKVAKKLEKLRKQAEKLGQPSKKGKSIKKKRDELQNLKDLTFKKTRQRVEIDEPLNQDEEQPNLAAKIAGELAKPQKKSMESEPTSAETVIDPNKVTTITWKQKMHASDAMNDVLADDNEADYDEADAAAERQLTISQAFEDDDIIADFNKDKTKDSELKNTELQLAMPGWGSWAGAGISQEIMNRRNKRLLLKLAAPEKRRDDNKNNVYINETTSKQARAHMVSSIPFPFTSMADYEASIRAPIGRNFVPETAFRMLTRPAIITRKGQVIEPMDESELVKPDRRLRHIVDRRIDRLQNPLKATKVQ